MPSRSGNRMFHVYLMKNSEYLTHSKHCDRWCELKIVSHFNMTLIVKEREMHEQKCYGISEERKIHSSLGLTGDLLQEVALDLEQDWESVENVLNCMNSKRHHLYTPCAF